MDRYYRVLGLERGAAEDDVKRAYRKKALQLHPDRNPNGAEAFKALRDAYEAALADVKRRGADFHGAPAFPFHTTFSTSAGAAGAAAAGTAAGPGFRFARAAAGAAPPLFTEAELFGDAIPGGWRGAGARRAGDGAGSPEAAEADARWRRAHGSRVPVSAYEGAGPMPSRPAPPPSSQPAAAAAATAQSRGRQPPHAAQPSPPSAPAGSRAGDAEESAEDRAYREAMFLLRRMQDMTSKDTDPTRAPPAKPTRQPTTRPQASATAGPAGGGAATEAERKAELHRQWKDMDATLRRKLGATGGGASGASSLSSSASSQQGPSGESNGRTAAAHSHAAHQRSSNGAAAAAAPSGPTLGDTWREVRQAHDQVHKETLLDERLLLQREYMRYRYCPNPADVGEMSDMEVFLLTSLMDEMQHRMHAVLEARLRKGPCSACREAPRAQSRLFFTCTHASVCEECHAAGVLRCPLCGAPRASAQGQEDTAQPSATRGRTASPLPGASAAPPSSASPARGVDGAAGAAAAGAGTDHARSTASAPRQEPTMGVPPSQLSPADDTEVSAVPS